MSTPGKYHHAQQAAAAQAVHELRILARNGDAQAVAAIRNIALHTLAVLQAIDTLDVPKHSRRWPVALDAVKEIRDSDLARFDSLEVGSLLGIRLEGKKRGFDYDEHTGFADDLFQQLDTIRRNPARHLHPADEHPELAAPGVLTESQLKRDWRNLAALLEPLTKETLPAWTSAALELCREDCMGDWSRFPWPDCVMGKAGKDTDGNGSFRSTESAVRGKISEGLAMLILR